MWDARECVRRLGEIAPVEKQITPVREKQSYDKGANEFLLRGGKSRDSQTPGARD